MELMVGLLHILTVKESDSASLHAQVLGVAEYPVLHLSILSIPLKVIESACMNKTRLAKTKYFKPSEYHIHQGKRQRAEYLVV